MFSRTPRRGYLISAMIHLQPWQLVSESCSIWHDLLSHQKSLTAITEVNTTKTRFDKSRRRCKTPRVYLASGLIQRYTRNFVGENNRVGKISVLIRANPVFASPTVSDFTKLKTKPDVHFLLLFINVRLTNLKQDWNVKRGTHFSSPRKLNLLRQYCLLHDANKYFLVLLFKRLISSVNYLN